MEKTAVILTKSYKNHHLCVAGIDLETKHWIRFVSNNEETHGAIEKDMIQYQNGEYCQIGDTVKVQVLGHKPALNQPENYLIDERYYWMKSGSMSLDDVLEIHNYENRYVPCIFQDTWSYINEDELNEIDQSLVMVKVCQLIINPEFNGQIAFHKCEFSYKGDTYRFMSITDPAFRNENPPQQIGKAILIVSLPDAPSEGKFYKCVAKIFTLDGLL